MHKEYLEKLRENSFYPTFRGFIDFISVVGYIAAALLALFGIILLVSSEGTPIAILIIFGSTVLAAFIKASKEVSLMVADIADAIIDFAGSQSSGN